MNHQICRCCLLENPTLMYNIFIDDTLLAELNECVPSVKLEPQDGLSQVVCEQCRWHLREASEFRRRCVDADRELRRRYDDTTRSIEEALDLFNGMLMEACVGGDEQHRRHHEEAVSSLNETPTPNEFGSLDMSILNEYLLEDCSFSSIPTETSTSSSEDPIISEFLNDVLTDANSFENTLSSFPSWDYNDTAQNYHIPADNFYSTATETSSSDTASQLRENLASPCRELNAMHTNPASVSSHNTTMTTNATNSSPRPRPTKKSTPKSLHPCPECEKKFTRNFQLKLHLISVHNIGDGLQYTCTDCEKTFASRHSLSYHQKSIHSMERPFGCTHCTRRFVLRTQLASHLRTHSGELKPRCHPCAECDKNFLTKSDLRTHYTRSHTPDVVRPFQCHFCEKSFFTRGHLNSHLLVHTGEKPFACVFCGKAYQSVGNLNNHLVRRHSDVLDDSRQTHEMAIAV